MKQRIEKWWDSFVSLKWWVQAIIIAVVAVGIHNYILHQEVTMPKGIGTYGSNVGRPPMKNKKKKKKKKKKKQTMSGYTTSLTIREVIGTRRRKPLKANVRKKRKKRSKNKTKR